MQACLLVYKLLGGNVSARHPGDAANMFTFTGPRGIKVKGLLNEEEVMMAKQGQYLKGEEPWFRVWGSARQQLGPQHGMMHMIVWRVSLQHSHMASNETAAAQKVVSANQENESAAEMWR